MKLTDEQLDALAAAHEKARRAHWKAQDWSAPEGGLTVAEEERLASRAGVVALLELLQRDCDEQSVALTHSAIRRRLHARRFALGLGQREVAKRMGTAQSVVSELESGVTKDPGLGTLTRWAAAVGLQVDVSISPSDDVEKGLGT